MLSKSDDPTYLRFASRCLLLIVLMPFSAVAQPTKPTIVYGLIRPKEGANIYLMDADGGNERQLTHNDSSGQPAWSPDGTRIVFSSRENDQQFLAIMDCQGNFIEKIETPGAFRPTLPAWSPDGTQIAFVAVTHADGKGASDIFVLDLLTGAVRNLTHQEGMDLTPSWSPDGQWIVFASNRDAKFWLPDPGARLGFSATSDIYIMAVDGNSIRNVTQTLGDEAHPSLSPDGTEIVFTRPHGTLWSENQLYVIDVDGGNERRLTNFKGSPAIRSPSWSPDGQQLLFSATGIAVL